MISVLLPTYNSAPTIGSSVKSILNQTFQDFELLILDDGSTDDTERIISQMNDRRVHYNKLSHQGLAKTLNQGLLLARYHIIARMDADDLCVPWRFEKQLSVLRQLQRNAILSSWYGVFADSTLRNCVMPPTTSSQIKKGLLLHSYISHPGLICYKETLVMEGGYKSSNNEQAFEDYETWLRIKDRVQFHIIPEILVFQRYRQNSLSSNIPYKQRIMYSIQQPYYDDLRAHFGITEKWEEYVYRGWREYFYGSRNKARYYWKKLGFIIVRQPRVMLAWFVTFLPEYLFIQFKESGVKYRLLYLFFYYTNNSKTLRNQLDTLLNA